MGSEKQRLIKLFEEMNDQRRTSLLDYALYLSQQPSKMPDDVLKEQEKSQPLKTPRPDNENIVNAIKRLRASFFMLNTDGLLNETSALMGQFMVQGRAAEEVIDDLEIMFNSHYQIYLKDD